MEVKQRETFEAQIEQARQKPPGKLRAADIRRLLKTAGQRPTETQIAIVGELLAGSPVNSPIVFEVLGEFELSTKPDPRMALLRPTLWRTATSWLTQPPPTEQDLSKTREWLQGQLTAGTDGTPVPADRVRAVLLWLVSQFRSPDFFLRCLLEVGDLSVTKRKSAKSQSRNPDAASGFVMARLAKGVLAAGRGQLPKLGKLSEIARVAGVTLDHVREKSAAADAALTKYGELEGALAEQRRIAGEQEEKIRALELEKQRFEQLSREQAGEIERSGKAHQQAIDHTNAQVTEGKRAMLTDIRTKLEPKLKDARLYLDRPAPASAQALRLMAEMEEILKTREA